MPKIHKFAEVSPKAEIAEDVTIGSFSYIGDNVKIGKGTQIGTGVLIDGYVTIGENNQIFHHSIIGSPPQDFAYKGERSYLVIGNNNIIHEFATISPGTKPESTTSIGNSCMIMIGVHVAHNVKLGNNVVLVNYTALGGYVEIGDGAFLSGFIGVHQFVKIGKLAMIGTLSKITQDFPPFMMGQDIPVKIYGLNSVGMQRANFSQNLRSKIKKAYKILYHDKYNFSEALKVIQNNSELNSEKEIQNLVNFIKISKRGICQHH